MDGLAWTVPPFAGVIRDQCVCGRGATDTKGFLAVVLASVPQLKEAAVAAPVHLAFSYDEEMGCRGAPDLVRALMQSVAPPALVIMPNANEVASKRGALGARPVPARRGCKRVGGRCVADTGVTTNPSRISIEVQNGL